MTAKAFGVYSPRGELEAVELSEEIAFAAAVNLSPDQKNPNRTVEPVTVVRGDPLKRMISMVAGAAHTSHARRLERYAQAVEAERLSGGKDWKPRFDAEQAKKTAHGVVAALAEATINTDWEA